MSELTGKHGLIVGIANKRSIAWAIAQSCRRGGRPARGDLPGRAARRKRARARRRADRSAHPAVRRHERCPDCRRDDVGRARVRRARFPRARRRVRAARGAQRSVRQHVARRLPDRARRQRLLAHCAHARRGAADGCARRRQHSHAHLSRQRARVRELQRDGRRQGRARGERALPGQRSGPAEHPRERHLGRPDQDARCVRHRRLLEDPAGLPGTRAAAPQRRERAKWPIPRVSSWGPPAAASPAASSRWMAASTSWGFRSHASVPVPGSMFQVSSTFQISAAFLVRSAQVATASNAAGTPCALRHFACSLLRLEETA